MDWFLYQNSLRHERKYLMSRRIDLSRCIFNVQKLVKSTLPNQL